MVEGSRIRYPQFADRVQSAMKEHGVTKKQIVKALNLKTEEMARRYILGIAKPREHGMVKLAALLKFPSAAHLDYGEESHRRPSSAGEPEQRYGLTAEALEIARAFMRLPDFKQRQHAKAIMSDATLLDVFPELESAMRAALVATDPDYHKLTEGFIKSRANMERQLKLKLDP